MAKITPFFMFSGQAEEAMRFYVSLFGDAEVLEVIHNEDGTVQQGIFRIQEQLFMAIDSSEDHDFTFTPAVSLFVNCDSDAEIDQAYGLLKSGGAILMPLDAYPFSRKFAWVQDKYGLSWQLNLPEEQQTVN
ncbi:VOC family protein [Indiicoccus explosivorum]|uniref:VOC family protein n=1 Tax=Indiicoccus explosivorum TaxID=1917864 RepID=UPI001F4E60B2|nr:VOC family protein [Indiicoccus explosivorum]